MQKPFDELVSEMFFSLIAYFHTKIFFKEGNASLETLQAVYRFFEKDFLWHSREISGRIQTWTDVEFRDVNRGARQLKIRAEVPLD